MKQELSGKGRLHEEKQKILGKGVTFGGLYLAFTAAAIGLICSRYVLLKALAAFPVLLREVQRASR